MPLMLLLVLVLAAQSGPSQPTAPAARAIAADTFLLPGAILPERGPDGNTVLVTAPQGLVVVDTGRHAWHSDGILAFARARKQPIAIIVNTHWHLDHSSGNGRIKAEHPGAKVYTTRAVDRALAPEGFLTRNLKAARQRPVDPSLSAARREETEIFFATMEKPESLKADVAIERTGPMTFAGRRLSIRVAANAVTDADVWMYDEATAVAIIGDLVTLPAPFFETACPARWENALDEVWATPFKVAIPGHGAPMTREQFDVYRGAFKRFRTCVATESPAATCGAAWAKDVSPLLDTDADRRQAVEYGNYYVDFLRKGGGASADCQAR